MGAGIGNAGGKPFADPHLALNLRQQQHTAVRGEPTAVKRGCDFLASDRWESDLSRAIVTHGGCGLWHFMPRCGAGFDNQLPTASQCLRPLLSTLLEHSGTQDGLDWSAGSLRTSTMQRPCGDCGQKHEAGDVIKPNRD
jgi:hypothetical protein